ncbi:secreted protein, suppressor for copper-sensitivity C precursor [Salmonella enterica subsp. enterica]|uniref:Secreted protein, suppressor for copper-sensitivity C n=2 Tax=Salmonella enterica I TaxID=59201 RepID=A0A3S4F7Y7_SALET|nr:secreted protein, suppressor for copper-sensitivity C precursor [Salmonella enterica subsp. enterica]
MTLDEKSMETIRTNLQLARLVGVQGTPATIIGDELIPGAVPWDTLEAVVKEKLAAANGGVNCGVGCVKLRFFWRSSSR